MKRSTLVASLILMVLFLGQLPGCTADGPSEPASHLDEASADPSDPGTEPEGASGDSSTVTDRNLGVSDLEPPTPQARMEPSPVDPEGEAPSQDLSTAPASTEPADLDSSTDRSEAELDLAAGLDQLALLHDLDAFLELDLDPRPVTTDDFLPIDNTNFLPIDNVNELPLEDDLELSPPTGFDRLTYFISPRTYFLTALPTCANTSRFDENLQPVDELPTGRSFRSDVLDSCRDPESGRRLSGRLTTFYERSDDHTVCTTIARELRSADRLLALRLVRQHQRQERISKYVFTAASEAAGTPLIRVALSLRDVRFEVAGRRFRLVSGRLNLGRGERHVSLAFFDLVFARQRSLCAAPLHGRVELSTPANRLLTVSFNALERDGTSSRCEEKGHVLWSEGPVPSTENLRR